MDHEPHERFDFLLFAGAVAAAIVLSFLFAVAALAQPSAATPGVGLVAQADTIQFAGGACAGVRARLNPDVDPYRATGLDPYARSTTTLTLGGAVEFYTLNANRYGGFPHPSGASGSLALTYGGIVDAMDTLPAAGGQHGRVFAVRNINHPHTYRNAVVAWSGEWLPLPRACMASGPRGGDPHGIFAEGRLKELFAAGPFPGLVEGTSETHNGRPTTMEEMDCYYSSGLWSRVMATWQAIQPEPPPVDNPPEDDPPPIEDPPADDPEEPVEPPPPVECACDLTMVNARLDLLSEAVSEAGESRDDLERAHDLRLDELERAVEELRQAPDPDPPTEEDPPPAECWTEAKREAALEAWALDHRNPAMIARGDSGARVLEIIRGNPESHLARALAAYGETLPPVCKGQGNEDGGQDVAGFLETAPGCWPGPNSHCETTTRCTVHTWAIHGKVPLKPSLAAKRSCGTPNHRLLRAAELYLRTGESDDILDELRVGPGAPLMSAEQGGYPPAGDYHVEGAVGAALAATAREDPEVLAAARGWLASYCSYVELLSVAGESHIPGPRVQSEYGTDPVRDDACAILAGTKRPRGGDWSALDFDAARRLATPLAGTVTWSRADLPPVLSPLTIYVHERGKVARVDEYAKAAGGPLWAVAVDRDGNKASVSWREAGATHWSCGRNAPPDCVPAKRWFGRQKEIPAELDTSALDLGPVVEEWVLNTGGARRVR